MDKNVKNYLLITTNQQFEYSDYLEYCEMNEITPMDENSQEFFEWCDDETQTNIECDFDNLECAKIANADFVLTGSIGRWNGTFDIKPMHYTSLTKAIKAAIGECDYYDVRYIDGVIEISASHHDGTNSFKLRLLSKKGISAVGNACGLVEKDPKDYWFKKIRNEDIF